MSSELGLSPEYHPLGPVLDGVGIFYIVGCGVWTLLITCGMAFLYSRRGLPFLRIRRLKLTFLATYILHAYWILVLVGYTLAPVIPEELLFWMTSILYPIGLGLFFVSNAELLEVARIQHRFAVWNGSSDLTLLEEIRRAEKPKRGLSGAYHQFSKLDFSLRMIIVVVLGWLFQIFFTVAMFLISRKFHSTWGIQGTQVTGNWYTRHMAQGKGWEWWPAVAWQFFWYWIVAPLILWRARHIRDTHGWRIQTSVCCISVLFTLPMWLIALYVPGMRACNRWWIPVAWIGVSIWFIEAFTVWIPCYQVLRHQTLQQDTLDAIAVWEQRTKHGGSDSVVEGRNSSSRLPASVTRAYEKMESLESAREPLASFESHSAESLYTMHALEHTLDQNPEPLRRFASLRDFTGENIAFLTAVREWRVLWTKLDDPPDAAGRLKATRRELFKQAVRIHATYASPKYAVFPLNLSARDYTKLDAMFGAASQTLYGDSEATSMSDVTPFSSGNDPLDRLQTPHSSNDPKDSMFSSGNEGMPNSVDYVTENVQYWGYIPQEFNKGAFDGAEKSIKYLVLTNTWPKFIREHRPGSSNSNSKNSKGSSRGKQSSPLGGLFSFKGDKY